VSTAKIPFQTKSTSFKCTRSKRAVGTVPITVRLMVRKSQYQTCPEPAVAQCGELNLSLAVTEKVL
jgi:hypothetical protein